MSLVYKIINPKGKIYIGQTINWVRRKSNYRRLNCKSQIKIYNSLKKYGVENHSFEIIEECNIEDLGIREKYWKNYYNSIQEGLNIRYDEEIGGKLCKSTCEKIAKAKKGKKYSKESSRKKSLALKNKTKTKEHCLNISKALKDIPKSFKGKKKPLDFGNKISQNKERGRKISESHKGKKHPRTKEWSDKLGKSISKPVFMLNLEGDILKEFQSAKKAGEYLNKPAASIGEVCRGVRKTAYGYKWKFKL